MFGSKRERRAVLLDGALQVARFLKRGTLIIELHRGQLVLRGFVALAQGLGELFFHFSGLFYPALLAQRALQNI